MKSADISSSQPILNRDLQILIGEHIFTKKYGPDRYISNGFFNFFVAGPIVKCSVISTLSKMNVFTLNDRRARISSSTDEKKFICVDFRELTGYVYLEQLIKLMNESKMKFFDVLHLISLKGVDTGRLFRIFMLLKNLTVINLPYEFNSFSRNGEAKMLDKLIDQNAATLRSLHHLVYPFHLCDELRKRVIAINSATLRTGTMEREADFFAFYMDLNNCPKELLPPECGGISMSISINRCKEVLRSIKRAFQRDRLRSQITRLRLSSTYDFDVKSAQILLTQIERVRSTLPNVQSLGIELRTLELNPQGYNDDDFGGGFEAAHLVPSSASICSNVALFFLDWLRKKNMGDIGIDGCVRLDGDYNCDENIERTKSEHFLLMVLRETIAREVDQGWGKQLQESVIFRNGCASAAAAIPLVDKINFKFCIEFRSIIYCETSKKQHFDLGNHSHHKRLNGFEPGQNLFRVVNFL